MYISTKDWKAFVSRLSALNTKAGDAVSDYVAKNGFADKEALLNFCYRIANQYGNASTALAALMYDTVADLENVILPPADLVQAPTYDEVAKAVNGTLKTSENPNSIGGAVARAVKKAGQDTFIKNAQRDGAQFAWIPNGDTCPFCLMLASRGWEYAGKKNHATHIHSHCDCTYMVRHRSDFNVEGYDPKQYLRDYKDANTDTEGKITYRRDKNGKLKAYRQTSSTARVNAMRRENYAKHKEEIREQQNAAYALRQEIKDE